MIKQEILEAVGYVLLISALVDGRVRKVCKFVDSLSEIWSNKNILFETFKEIESRLVLVSMERGNPISVDNVDKVEDNEHRLYKYYTVQKEDVRDMTNIELIAAMFGTLKNSRLMFMNEFRKRAENGNVEAKNYLKFESLDGSLVLYKIRESWKSKPYSSTRSTCTKYFADYNGERKTWTIGHRIKNVSMLKKHLTKLWGVDRFIVKDCGTRNV